MLLQTNFLHIVQITHKKLRNVKHVICKRIEPVSLLNYISHNAKLLQLLSVSNICDSFSGVFEVIIKVYG